MLGRPIAHSLSPVLHRAAYAELGLNWDYRAIECDETDLARVLGEGADYAGFSCTMPLKREALRLASSASARAVAIGAANTLVPAPDGWRADNTDWIGVRDGLAADGVAADGHVLVLGAGGTAQAVLAALPPGAEVTVAVREPARTTALGHTAARLDLRLTVIPLDQLPATDLVVSTLPPGAGDRLRLPPHRALLDVVYAGWPTPLARRARSAGAQVVSGASVLLFQAAAQVELMTGRAAPVAAMRAALLAAVPGCGA